MSQQTIIRSTAPITVHIHGDQRLPRSLAINLLVAKEGDQLAQTTADPAAGLEWSPSSDRRMTHAEAAQWCRDMRHGGHSDWRLPTLHELQSIVDYTRHNPACDPAFPDTKPEAYWTSSPDASDPAFAWFVYFSSGGVSLAPRYHLAWVRAVRVPRASQ